MRERRLTVSAAAPPAGVRGAAVRSVLLAGVMAHQIYHGRRTRKKPMFV